MTKLIEGEFDKALPFRIRRKPNRTGKIRFSGGGGRSRRAQAKRVAYRAPEVVVKITGFKKGRAHGKVHMEYISRNGKCELETDRGEILQGRKAVDEYFSEWAADFGDKKRHKNQRDMMSLFLSMPSNTNPEDVLIASRQFAKETFGKNHEYVIALHTDSEGGNPHCHVTVKCRGFNGRMLRIEDGEPQLWREAFARNLRQLGVDAEATPRVARGVVKKAENSVIRRIERGDKTHAPRVSKVGAARVKETAQELIAENNGVPLPPKPWEAVIQAQQDRIRTAWLSAADALEQEKTRLTFNHKEKTNDRPDYEGISAEHARNLQRSATAYLHQSGYQKSGRGFSARPITSLRDMSGRDVVYPAGTTEMLLSPDALNRLERRPGTHHDVRWAGDRVTGNAGEPGRVKDRATQNKEFAARIRDFVRTMPPVMTQMQEIKTNLFKRFGRSAGREMGQVPER